MLLWLCGEQKKVIFNNFIIKLKKKKFKMFILSIFKVFHQRSFFATKPL